MIIKQNTNRASIYRRRNDIILSDKQLSLPKKQTRSLNLFCFGFFIYTLGFILSFIETENIGADTSQGIQIAGMVLLIIGSLNLIQFKFDNKYLKIVFPGYIIYVLTIILRAGKLDYNSLKTILFNVDYSIFVYILPLIIFFPRSLVLYKKIFALLIPFGIFFLIFSIRFSKILLNPTWENNNEAQYVIECIFLYLAYPLALYLLTYIYHKPKIKILAFLVILLSIYFLIFRARRGSLFMCLTTLSGVLVVYLIYTRQKILVAFLSVFLVLFFYIFLSGVRLPHTFDFLMARKDEDTRTYVEVCMKADMKPMDWVIGKGINGTYYCPGINPLSDQRNIIETGYLQIILQGGIISLALLGLIVVPAVYLGLFRSTNILCKGVAIFILLWMIYQYPRIVNSFSMYYLLVWISVSICYSKNIRNMSDSTIKKCLYN